MLWFTVQKRTKSKTKDAGRQAEKTKGELYGKADYKK